MSLSTKQLKMLRWAFIISNVSVIVSAWIWQIRGGWAVIWMGLFLLTGFPAAALTLHLYPPKFLQERKR